jgi:hypothetical protein
LLQNGFYALQKGLQSERSGWNSRFCGEQWVFCIATQGASFYNLPPGNGSFNLSVEPGQLLAPALLIPALDLCSGMVPPTDWVLFVASAIAAHISGHYCGAMEQFQPVSHQLTNSPLCL